MSERKYVSLKNESARLFKSDWMEVLSKVHFTVPIIIYIPVVGYFLYKAFNSAALSTLNIVGWFLFGMFIWTITEYTMHRFVFHFHPKSEFGKRIHFIFHGVHHDYPNDSLRLVLPPSVSVPLALGFYFLFNLFFQTDALFPFFAGFILGYVIYDELHYAIHHVEIKGKLWNVLKTHHLKHHYVDDHKGYGVSSPLWDIIVRSDFPKKKLTNNTNS